MNFIKKKIVHLNIVPKLRSGFTKGSLQHRAVGSHLVGRLSCLQSKPEAVMLPYGKLRLVSN